MKIATALIAVLGVGATAMFASGQATTEPSQGGPSATVTENVTPAPAPLPSPAPVVLVAPFQQVGSSGAYAWVGQAIQEDLLASVARDGLQAKSTDKMISGSDTSAALQAGHDAAAAFVITGSYQVVGDQLRVNGQTSDVAGGRATGSIQATGEVRGLFSIEDSLGGQLRSMLPQMAAGQLPTVSSGPQGSPYSYLSTAPGTASTGGGLYSNYGPSTQATPNYVYDQEQNPAYSDYPPVAYAPYSDYGYAYPYSPYFFGGGFVIVGNGFDHRFDHGHFGHFFGGRHIGFSGVTGSAGFGVRPFGGFGGGAFGHSGFGRR